jgi:hypothetical protein
LIKINAMRQRMGHQGSDTSGSRTMAGITLSAEEIKAAPPEVRRWLEQEMVRAFGVQPAPAPAATHALVGCNVEEARDMLALLQGMLPAVSVFFELGREAASVAVHGLRAFRIADILRHARLQSPDQAVQCLEVLAQALQRVRGDPEAAFFALDDHGHCMVAEATMRSIFRLWQEIVAQRGLRSGANDIPVQPVEASA